MQDYEGFDQDVIYVSCDGIPDHNFLLQPHVMSLLQKMIAVATGNKVWVEKRRLVIRQENGFGAFATKSCENLVIFSWAKTQ